MLTEVLLEVTNGEIKSVAEETYEEIKRERVLAVLSISPPPLSLPLRLLYTCTLADVTWGEAELSSRETQRHAAFREHYSTPCE